MPSKGIDDYRKDISLLNFSTSSNYNDFQFSIYMTSKMWNDFINVGFDFLNLHFINDSNTYRITSNFMLDFLFFGVGLSPSVSNNSKICEYIGKTIMGIILALNSTIEFFPLSKWNVPIFGGIGYNFDWFVFSPYKDIYILTHADLGFCLPSFKWWRFSFSIAYKISDTYAESNGWKWFVRFAL